MNDVRSDSVERPAQLVEKVRTEHARPAGHATLAAVQDVARKVAGGHGVFEHRRLEPVGVLEAVAREQRVAARTDAVVDADVELVDVVVEDAVRDEVVVEEAGAGHVGRREQVQQLAPPTSRNRNG